MNYLAQIEALLFVAGEEGLSLRHLASMVNLTPTALQQQLEKLTQKYEADESSSLCLIETAGCQFGSFIHYCLQTTDNTY